MASSSGTGCLVTAHGAIPSGSRYGSLRKRRVSFSSGARFGNRPRFARKPGLGRASVFRQHDDRFRGHDRLFHRRFFFRFDYPYPWYQYPYDYW
jgi:hypothetical protein